MTEGGSYFFYRNDHLGTPQKLVDVSGAVVWSAEYTAFGEAVVDPASTVETNLRFPGQYFDEETGLHYNWNRYYDPETGIYISKDPISFAGGDVNLYRYTDSVGKPIQFSANLYHYTFNNPINLKDPSGLDPYGRNGNGVNNVTRCHVNPHNDRDENLLALLAALGLTAGPEASALITRYWPYFMTAAGTQAGQRAIEGALDFSSGALLPGPPGPSPTSAAGSLSRYLADMIGLTPSN